MMSATAPLSLEQLYADHRRFLWSLCYRMLGSAADAEDVVQDTFVRAMERPPRQTADPVRPWLVKVALNLSRDLLRRRRRREYVGPWLPSPIDTGDESAPPSHEPVDDPGWPVTTNYDLLESVSFAFLLALEELTPTQRAVLILRDVFDYSIKETADALDLSDANVKTTHHRARRAMDGYDKRRRLPTPDLQSHARAALDQFLGCLARHDVKGIEALLADDVRTMTDGGGEFRAALRTIVGRDKVTRFYLGVAELARDVTLRSEMLNGMPAVVVDLRTLQIPRQSPRFTLSVDLDTDGRISALYVVSATRKLSAIR
jgi:RNA polymerase sigma-70 factor (ECF subfamily)